MTRSFYISSHIPIHLQKPWRVAHSYADQLILDVGGGYGEGTVVALKHGAAELIDPRPYAVGKLAYTFEKYPEIGVLLSAMGYGEEQVKDLEKTIAATPCDAVVIGTPIDLGRVVKINQPTVKVGYELQEIGYPNLEGILQDFCKKHKLVK
ncbi:MAG: hypothetical protein LBR66_02000 [Candidatus Symbiothrix sp.]|jgi:predicted GTPase|nr:hypothetical protein [Candidatus Symbiothrix sp.]